MNGAPVWIDLNSTAVMEFAEPAPGIWCPLCSLEKGCRCHESDMSIRLLRPFGVSVLRRLSTP